MPMPFGIWLLSQYRPDELIGVLADEVRKDPNFPRCADDTEVEIYMKSISAEGYLIQGVYEASREWQREESP